LRLAVVSPFVDRRHGTERALAELLDRLAHRYQCEIHLYAERVEDLALDQLDVPRPGGRGAIFWHKVPCLGGPHLAKFLSWTVSNSLVRWADRVFRGLSFDLVVSPGINCPAANVVIVHALFHRIRELSRQESPATSKPIGFFRRLHRRAYYGLLTWLERRIYSNPKVSLVAVSQRTADLLAQNFQRTDVPVVSNGVDTTRFSVSARLAARREARERHSFRDADFVLLLIGNDWRVKGVPAILAAMAAIPAVPLHLLVVGNDECKPFQEMAERLGVGSRCHWEAPCSDVIELYGAADAYVSPSLEDSFGLPVAEAMACGLPAITSIFAGISPLVRDGVDAFVLRDPDDAGALSQLFAHLQADEGLRSRIGQAAAKTAQEWTWERNAEAIWNVISLAATKRK
jgi:glycosyltransferase involved in cell wall biosynthesis